jgi:hypothetical protein
MVVTGEINRVRVARPGQESQATLVTDQALAALISSNYFSVLGVCQQEMQMEILNFFLRNSRKAVIASLLPGIGSATSFRC